MSNNLVYLCGKITGATYEEARYGWRLEVVEACRDLDIEFLSPMRAKEHLCGIKDLSPMGGNHVLSTAHAITTRDRFDVSRCSLIFANFLGMGDKTNGCSVEFGWADMLRKPIICCIEPDGSNPNEHAIITDLIGWRCDTLAQGIEVLRAVFAKGL